VVGQAIVDIVVVAVEEAVFRVPIIAVVLLLVRPRAAANGTGFVFGWVLGLAAVGAVALLLSPDASEDGGAPATWASLLLLALGIASVGLAVAQWRGRPGPDDDPDLPAWMSSIRGFDPRKSLGTGAALAGANPKNVLLALAAAAEIVQTGIPAGEQAIAYGVFVLIASIGVATPVLVYVATGDGAAPLLERVEKWMARNSAVIMTILLLMIGAKLVGDAIAGLSL
jgi:threonine/homoserine/homoserine lactone efflux protein